MSARTSSVGPIASVPKPPCVSITPPMTASTRAPAASSATKRRRVANPSIVPMAMTMAAIAVASQAPLAFAT